jgi:hypothetical protein
MNIGLLDFIFCFLRTPQTFTQDVVPLLQDMACVKHSNEKHNDMTHLDSVSYIFRTLGDG